VTGAGFSKLLPLSPGVIPLGLLLKASVALLSLGFGLAVLLAAPRRAANRLLAVFLGLIALNHGAEAARDLLPSAPALLGRVAFGAAAADPIVLLAFLRAQLPGHGPRGAALLACLATSGVLLGAAAGLLPGGLPREDPAWLALLFLFTLVAYALAVVAAQGALVEAPTDPARRLLLTGASIVMMSSTGRVIEWSAFPLQETDWLHANPGLFLALLLASAALAFALVAVVPRAPREARRALLGAALAGLAATLLMDANYLEWNLVHVGVLARTAPVYLAVSALGTSFGAARWILFGILVSLAAARHQMMEIGPAARRRIARIVVACLALSVVLLVLSATEAATAGTPWSVGPGEWVLLGVVLVASQAFRSLVDAIARRTYGLGPADERALDALTPGARVAGRYVLVRPLGRGSGGRAFLARDEVLRRDVCIKQTPLDRAEEGARALEEARLAGSLRHPNVLTVHDAIRAGDSLLIVTEHVAGGTLQERAEETGRLPAAEGARLLRGVLEGLAAVHAAGIVHRDLKPSNVLLDADLSPRIADFGLARVRTGATLAAGDFAGTPEYMAPEQLRGEPATPASDVHAVGLLARRCLQPLPARLGRVVDRALLADPAARWPSAREMAAALRLAMEPERAAHADNAAVPAPLQALDGVAPPRREDAAVP
jgi:Protein kinase domain